MPAALVSEPALFTEVGDNKARAIDHTNLSVRASAEAHRPPVVRWTMNAQAKRRFDAHRVVPGLWVGAFPMRGELPALIDEGIDAVVDLRGQPDAVLDAWPENVEVHVVDLSSEELALTDLRAAADTVASLMSDGREVLVHCVSGVQRAPTVACAALVVNGWPLREAYATVVGARPVAQPTPEQLDALRALAGCPG